jgi:hypothetical protein
MPIIELRSSREVDAVLKRHRSDSARIGSAPSQPAKRPAKPGRGIRTSDVRSNPTDATVAPFAALPSRDARPDRPRLLPRPRAQRPLPPQVDGRIEATASWATSIAPLRRRVLCPPDHRARPALFRASLKSAAPPDPRQTNDRFSS